MEKITRDDIARMKAEKAARIKQGQQLHAKIKRSSEYYGQTAPDELFEVFVDPTRGGYCVQGGPGVHDRRLKDFKREKRTILYANKDRALAVAAFNAELDARGG